MDQSQTFTQMADVPMLVVRPQQACKMLNVGLTHCYELINSGALESFKDGKSRKITVSSIHTWLARNVELAKGQHGVEAALEQRA